VLLTCVPPQGCKSILPIFTRRILLFVLGGLTDIVLTNSGCLSSSSLVIH
ncbi:uncharacterized protein METZ01_LOCUS334499, partial [marine metagenome]